jgi:hypothetical protein
MDCVGKTHLPYTPHPVAHATCKEPHPMTSQYHAAHHLRAPAPAIAIAMPCALSPGRLTPSTKDHPNTHRIAEGKEHPMFVIDGGKPLQVTGRAAEMLMMLMRGPVPAPNVKRHSDAVFKLRNAGVDIWTERVRKAESRIGIYHLRSNVHRASPAEAERLLARARKAVRS